MMTDDEVQALVGLTVEQARQSVMARGWQFRVLIEDGVSRPSTTDLRDDRVNVTVSEGKVEAADVG
jgi:hypothetical protein